MNAYVLIAVCRLRRPGIDVDAIETGVEHTVSVEELDGLWVGLMHVLPDIRVPVYEVA